MNTSFSFALVLLAVSLAACKPAATGDAHPAPANGTATATMAAASAPSANDAAMAQAANETVTRLAATQGPPLVAGTDYVAISGGQPFNAVPGKVEVAEVFGYVCPACNMFQPLVHAWKNSLPADVNFVYVPALFGGPWDNYARAYYAAEAAGLVDKTHESVYRAIHVDQSLKGERGMDTPEEIAAFYGHYGADPKQFMSAMQSFAVNSQITRAKQFAQRSDIGGTPSIIVNGKYRVQGKTREDDIRIANQLIAQERGAMAGASTASPPADATSAPTPEAAPASAPVPAQ